MKSTDCDLGGQEPYQIENGRAALAVLDGVPAVEKKPEFPPGQGLPETVKLVVISRQLHEVYSGPRISDQAIS